MALTPAYGHLRRTERSEMASHGLPAGRRWHAAANPSKPRSPDGGWSGIDQVIEEAGEEGIERVLLGAEEPGFK